MNVWLPNGIFNFLSSCFRFRISSFSSIKLGLHALLFLLRCLLLPFHPYLETLAPIDIS